MIVYEVGSFRLCVERRALTHSGKSVGAGAKVVETLIALVESSGMAVSKEALMERLWPDRFVEESNLAQNVYVLRKIFRLYGDQTSIETVSGYGYRLRAQVSRATVAPAAPAIERRRRLFAWPRIASIALVAALGVAFAFYTGSTGAPKPTPLSVEGARLYAIGRYYWNLRSAAGVENSMRYFARVIDLDPTSPLGYVGLADANESMGDYCYGSHRPSVYFARARVYAMEALSLDPGSAPAHATLGLAELHAGRATAAAAEFRRAIAADPQYAAGHEWYGIALARQGQLREGWAQLSLAARLDPLSVATLTWMSRLAFSDGRVADAAVYRAEAAELSPQLVARPSPPPNHPAWASIEDGEHAPPTGSRRAAYIRHETIFTARAARRAADRAGHGLTVGAGDPYQR
ncbi:MAG TPA: winged helix-turn-helix domain-containing protein [Candidatus Binatia bacterium]|nr:winged helix-turn-helix domain-containing protein [Candidatus Binatia bacterium]